MNSRGGKGTMGINGGSIDPRMEWEKFDTNIWWKEWNADVWDSICMVIQHLLGDRVS